MIPIDSTFNNILALREQEYRTELREFWLVQMLPMAILFGCLIFGGCYWLSGLSGPGGIDWRIAAGLFTFGVMILPYFMFKPSKPTPLSVAYDGLLNEIGEASCKHRQN